MLADENWQRQELETHLQRNNDLLQKVQRQVDVPSLTQRGALDAGAEHALRAGQVHQRQLGPPHSVRASLHRRCVDREHELVASKGYGCTTQRTAQPDTSSCTCRASMWIVKRQCEREDAWFMGVSLMVRFVSPKNSCMSTAPSLPEWLPTLKVAHAGCLSCTHYRVCCKVCRQRHVCTQERCTEEKQCR